MENQNYKPMTIGEWLITFIISVIPIVGIIMWFIWAFGGDTHPSKRLFAQISLIPIPILGIITLFLLAFSSNTNPNMKTFAQASLILLLIFVVLFIIFIIMFWTFIGAMIGGMGGTYS